MFTSTPSPLLSRWEERALRAARHHFGGPSGVGAARAVSAFGEHAAGWLTIGAAGAALDAPRRRAWTQATASVATAHAAASILKRVVRRPRPAYDDLPVLVRTMSGLSFPSSHMASSSAAALAFRPLLPPGLLAGAALAMGLSRMILGAHYASDVLAGAALGVGTALLLGPEGRLSQDKNGRR